MRFWCDRTFAPHAKSLFASYDATIPIHTIAAGKFRRYHHLSVLRQLLWPKLVLLNIRDSFLVGLGYIQSLFKMLIWRPDVVFTKGGYVCLPVGLAAKTLRIPLVIHDSDAHPGLTNRVLAKWASAIGTGAPLEYYNYPKSRSHYVGIPLSADFHAFSAAEKQTAREKWGIDTKRPLVVITGGGLGAKRINDTVAEVLDELLELGNIVLISGSSQYDELRALTPENNDNFQLYPFVSEGMAGLLGAADVVVSRAGATTMLELAALQIPTIIVPNAKLTGGHQLKNAKVYGDARAAVIVDEDAMVTNPQLLINAVKDLIRDRTRAVQMSKRFATFARPDAAKDMAGMVIAAVRHTL